MDAQLRQIIALLNKIVSAQADQNSRLQRTETRLTRLMQHMGLDRNGDPLPPTPEEPTQ